MALRTGRHSPPPPPPPVLNKTSPREYRSTTGNVRKGSARRTSPARNAMRRPTIVEDDQKRRSLSLRPSNSVKRSKSSRGIQLNLVPSERLRASFRQSMSRLSLSERRPRKTRSSPRILARSAELADASERATIYMAAADEAARVGDIMGAQEHLRDVLRSCKDVSTHTTAEVLALLGIVADRLGHTKEAEILLNESLGKSGDIQSFVPLFVLQRIYSKTGRVREAERMQLHGDKFRKFIVQ